MFVVAVFSNWCSKKETFSTYLQAEQAYERAIEQESNEIVTFMNDCGNVYAQHINL